MQATDRRTTTRTNSITRSHSRTINEHLLLHDCLRQKNFLGVNISNAKLHRHGRLLYGSNSGTKSALSEATVGMGDRQRS
jgi:hypothetical protein